MATAIRIEGTNGVDFARVVAVPVGSGQTVKAGQVVLEVENHKVVQEFEATAGGLLYHDLRAGDFVRLDVPVAFIAQPGEDASALTAEARAAKLGAEPPGGTQSEQVAGASPSVAKMTEISVLGGGAGNSLLATLGVVIGAVHRNASTPHFFRDKVLDLIVYEASRLLASKKYRVLNSRYLNGRIVPHDQVITGISFDEGGRLTIYSLPEADKLSLAQTQDRITEGLMRYVGRKLTIEEAATSTLTITDTSAAELNLSVPLLPRDQCIILSLVKDGSGSYNLSISYDHRVTEGLTVAAFAGELVQRVRSYSEPDEAACAFCLRTASAEVTEFKRRGLLKVVDSSGKELFCCATCWENW